MQGGGVTGGRTGSGALVGPVSGGAAS